MKKLISILSIIVLITISIIIFLLARIECLLESPTSKKSTDYEYEGDFLRGYGETLGIDLYGKYAKNIPENYVKLGKNDDELFRMLNKDTKIICENIDKVDLSQYNLSIEAQKNIVKKYKEYNNASLSIKTNELISERLMKVQISYDIEIRYGIYDHSGLEEETIYEDYFPEPIINIRFVYPSSPPFIDRSGFDRLYLTKDGEIVGELGKWFVEEVDIKTRDEYAKKYLNLVQKLLGVEQTDIKYREPYPPYVTEDMMQKN